MNVSVPPPGAVTIQVAVPADQPFLRVLRVAAATAVADRTDMQGLDNVRLAIDELAAGVIEVAPPGGLLHVDMDVGPGSLSVQGRARADGRTPTLSEIGELLVQSICRAYEVRRVGDDLVFSFTMDLVPITAQA